MEIKGGQVHKKLEILTRVGIKKDWNKLDSAW